jgi:hypothetical protein
MYTKNSFQMTSKIILIVLLSFFIEKYNCQIMNKVADMTMADALYNTTQFSRFGAESAVSGDYAVVGACGYAYGSFFVLEKNSGGEWYRKQEFNPHLIDATPSNIGRSVDIDGDYIIVG